MNKVFYHNDADGQCAAHVIANYFGDSLERGKKGTFATHGVNNEGNFIEDYIEINYNMDFPLDKIEKDEEIYIVDFSIDPKTMALLYIITNNVHWIDHHKTAIDKYKDYPEFILGLRSTEHSGCELTWLYMNDGYFGGKLALDDIPAYVRYIGDRDTWQWKFEDTANYCSGAELYDLHPLSEDWAYLMNNVSGVIKQGKTVEKYKKQRNEIYFNAFGYETMFEGHTACVINLGMVGSEIFGDKLKDYDMGIMYVHLGNEIHVGLRSEKIDVSKIALKYGGGGHPGASGFECKELPWINDCRCHHIDYTQIGKKKEDGSYCDRCGRKFLDKDGVWVDVEK